MAYFHFNYCFELRNERILGRETAPSGYNVTPFRRVRDLQAHVFQHNPMEMYVQTGTEETASPPESPVIMAGFW